MGGGLPVGRITEIYGDTSSGKSLIAAQACAAVQDAGGIGVYIDTETAVSLAIMRSVGVDVDHLIYAAPDTVEDVFSIMETAINKHIDGHMLIVWDSIAATSSAAEMDKDTGQVGYLTQARVISQGLRRITRMISKKQVTILFLNQAKEQLGVIFGDKTATFGGKAVGFHSSVRMQMRQGAKIKNKDKRIIGIIVNAKCTKNKIAPPFRESKLPVYFGHGIDEVEAIFTFLKDAGVISSTGAGWYKISINKKEYKVKKAGFEELLDDHYDAICDLVDGVFKETDLI
jgi:recombination protein RecA